MASVSTGPGPGPGPLWSNIALVWSRNIYWTGLGPCAASSFCCHFLHRPHFISATQKKKVIDVTASAGWISHVIEQYVHVCDIFQVNKLANSNLMHAYIESLIRFGLTRSKLMTFLDRSRSICGWTYYHYKWLYSQWNGDLCKSFVNTLSSAGCWATVPR